MIQSVPCELSQVCVCVCVHSSAGVPACDTVSTGVRVRGAAHQKARDARQYKPNACSSNRGTKRTPPTLLSLDNDAA